MNLIRRIDWSYFWGTLVCLGVLAYPYVVVYLRPSPGPRDPLPAEHVKP